MSKKDENLTEEQVLENGIKEKEEKQDTPKEEKEEKEDTKSLIENLMANFNEKFNKLESELEKERQEKIKEKENYDKIIEALKSENKKEDIIKEIEEKNKESDRLKKETDLLKQLEEAKRIAKEKDEAKKALEEKIKKDEIERQLELEKEKFKNLLLEEANKKPFLANKINKILKEEDYEEQKQLYKIMTKFIDEEEEEANWKMKKEAGRSAFEGVKTTDGKAVDNLTDFKNSYINKILPKKK